MRKTFKQVRPEDFDVETLMAAAREGRLYVDECRQRGIKLHTKRRAVSWDDDSPMTKLINMSQFERLRTILTEWQAYSKAMIISKRTTRFEFDIAYKKTIVLALKDGWEGNVPLFKVSRRQVLKYLSTHSNLGNEETLKKILSRNK